MNVRTLCLGILAQQDASGYEIKKAVEEGLFAHFIDASYGSIYPALTQMLVTGMCRCAKTTSPASRRRRSTRSPRPGRTALRKALHVTPKQDKYKSEFLFQALFKADLTPDHLEHVFDEQMTYLRRELAQVEECREQATPGSGHMFVNGYGHAVLSAAIDYMEKVRADLLSEQAGKPSDAAE
jgi:PadR family transcriptional regulator AphA